MPYLQEYLVTVIQMVDFLDKFIAFFEIIADTIVSLFEGLGMLLKALFAVSSVTGTVGVWMPSGLAVVVSVIFALALILRLVGR